MDDVGGYVEVVVELYCVVLFGVGGVGYGGGY